MKTKEEWQIFIVHIIGFPSMLVVYQMVKCHSIYVHIFEQFVYTLQRLLSLSQDPNGRFSTIDASHVWENLFPESTPYHFYEIANNFGYRTARWNAGQIETYDSQLIFLRSFSNHSIYFKRINIIVVKNTEKGTEQKNAFYN